MSRQVIEAVAGTGPRNLIFTMPPRHGKSEFCSVWLPLWMLETDPQKRVVVASYETTFAETFGRRVRDIIDEHKEDLHVRISPMSASASRWNTAITDGKRYYTQIGGMRTTGVGGPLTGLGADLLIGDDLIKNAEDAKSKTIRDNIWNWLNSTFLTRREPGCITVLVFTRWHEDDPIGRIENLINDPSYKGQQWKITNIPALAMENDPLGREPGDALWEDRYSAEYLRELEAGDPSTFCSLYQGQPTPAGGTVMQREWWSGEPNRRDAHIFPTRNRYDAQYCNGAAWPVIARFQSWDTGLKDTERSAYTVCETFDLLRDYSIALRDTYREKLTFDRLPDAIIAKAEEWNTNDILDTVLIEDKASGISALQTLSASAPEWLKNKLKSFSPSGDKETRARQISTWCRRGCLLFPTQTSAGRWLWVFEDEWFKFPGSTFKDQVDTCTQMLTYLEHYISEGYRLRSGMDDDIDANSDLEIQE